MPPNTEAAHQRLLLALAEELKLPLLQIAREAEVAGMQDSALAAESIRRTADMALRLVDGYILSLATAQKTSLPLEPLTVSSVLYDAAHRLDSLAKQRGYEIHVNIAGRQGPVMGNRQSLDAAFMLLGYGLLGDIEEQIERPKLMLGAHRSAHGVVAGVFTDNPMLSTDAFKRARALGGTARQTMPVASHGNGAGILIADSLLRYLSAPLKIARHQKHIGIAATLTPSRQLQLV